MPKNFAIKSLLKSGEVSRAAEKPIALLKDNPENVRAMMLFGTCLQFLGDDSAFELTHETVRDAMSRMPLNDYPELADEWAKFDGLHRQLAKPVLVRKGTKVRPMAMEYVALATLIAAALGVGFWLFGSQILVMVNDVTKSFIGGSIGDLYAGPRYEDFKHLYAGPREDTLEEKWITIDAGEDGPASRAD